MRRLAASAAVALLGATVACGGNDNGGWKEAAASPLSPRVAAIGVWTGEEVLVIGGETEPCPAAASCEPSTVAPLRDGAAYDPARDTWRTIAAAPIGFSFATSEQVGRTIYLWEFGDDSRPRAPDTFLAYDLDADRWATLPTPPRVGPRGVDGLEVAAGRIVLSATTRDGDIASIHAFDPGTRRWTKLPPDGRSPGFERRIVGTDAGLVLLDHERGRESPGAPLRVTEYSFERETWRARPDVLEYPSGAYTIEGEWLVPLPGVVDAPEPLARDWERLAHPPTGQEDFGDGPFATALLARDAGWYFRRAGWAWDATVSRWVRVPPLDGDGDVDGRLYVGAGRRLVAFGGFTWGSRIDLRNDAWVWSPDA